MTARSLDPDDLAAARAHWRSVPRTRPARIDVPGPGEESVWDYPRPPRLESSTRSVEVRSPDGLVARTGRPFRVCETAGPPVYYVPLEDVASGLLVPADRETLCEWKGLAHYWHVTTSADPIRYAGWSYPEPDEGFETLANAVAFYPGRVDCFVDGQRVRPQPGEFYGGWVTDEIRGPFKGEPGSEGW